MCVRLVVRLSSHMEVSLRDARETLASHHPLAELVSTWHAVARLKSMTSSAASSAASPMMLAASSPPPAAALVLVTRVRLLRARRRPRTRAATTARPRRPTPAGTSHGRANSQSTPWRGAN